MKKDPLLAPFLEDGTVRVENTQERSDFDLDVLSSGASG